MPVWLREGHDADGLSGGHGACRRHCDVLGRRQDPARPKVVKVIHDTVGVPMHYLPILAACEFAGALGIVAGIWWPPLGVAAGIGLVIYFVGAVASHLLVGDLAGIGPAVFVLALAAAALATRVMTM